MLGRPYGSKVRSFAAISADERSDFRRRICIRIIASFRNTAFMRPPIDLKACGGEALQTSAFARHSKATKNLRSKATFLIFDGDLYGDVLRVRFLHRIRDERKFSGIEELKTQIEKDTRTALNYFKRLGVKNSLDIV